MAPIRQYSPWELSVYKRVYRHKTCNYSHIRRTRQTMASWSAAITRFLIQPSEISRRLYSG